jgi:hypothetical protein
MVTGCLVAGLGLLLTDTVLSPRVGYADLGWTLPLVGVGFGMVLAPMTAVVMASVPPARAGMAAATTNASRQVGAAFGVAVLGALVNGQLTSELTARLRALGIPTNFQALVINAVTHGTRPSAGGAGGGGGHGANRIVQEVIAAAKDAFVSGLHVALLTAGCVLFAAAALTAVTVRNRRSAGRPRPAAAALADTRPEAHGDKRWDALTRGRNADGPRSRRPGRTRTPRPEPRQRCSRQAMFEASDVRGKRCSRHRNRDERMHVDHDGETLRSSRRRRGRVWLTTCEVRLHAVACIPPRHRPVHRRVRPPRYACRQDRIPTRLRGGAP